MEFWGVEVKPGETVKCDPGEQKLIHLSQAAIGETKDKGAEGVPIFVKFNDEKLVIGTLSGDKCSQISYDLVFEKEFELSHKSKNASIYFCGYRSVLADDNDDDEFDSEDDAFPEFDSEEDVQIAKNGNGKLKAKEQQGKSTVKAGKANDSVAKPNAKTAKPVKDDKPEVKDEDDEGEEESDEDDDSEDSEIESEDDEDMAKAMGDDSEEEDDESSDEEEAATPKKVVNGKKRAAESDPKTPASGKKAKLVTPSKTGGDKKKDGHVDTPHPAKQAAKTPKSSGSVTCKSCSKSFNSEIALQTHSKAKHGDSK